MNTRYFLLILSSLIFYNGNAQEKVSFQPTFRTSENTTHSIKEGQEFTFGYLKVLENRQNPKSRTIEIPVYIFKSRSKTPKKDPIIYTVGGPGETTMPSAQYMDYYQYLDDRDFILIEQRGNYYAKPHLDCPEWAQAVYEVNLPSFDETKSDALFEEAAKSCRERLTNMGTDLNGYNTNEIAADINDLVQVLNIERYNLLTISYSTKIAQVLMRDYPERIRSVVMDSPLPLEVNYDEESVGNLLGFTNQLLSDCEADPACKEAFPNIKDRFFEYLKEKTVNPLEVTVKNPKSGTMETFRLQGKDLLIVFGSLPTGNVPYIPSEIEKLLTNDLSSVKAQLSYLFQEPKDGDGLGMRLSVWCAEEDPFNSLKTIEEETYKYPEVAGLSPTTFDRNICDIWGVKKVAPIENKAIQSDIPTLLISGSYDALTPAKWAKNMMQRLSKSQHLIFNGWTHTPTTNWNNSCAMEAANVFFNNPNGKTQPDCFDQITMPKFQTK